MELGQNAALDALWVGLLLCLAHAKGKDIMAGAALDHHTLVAVAASFAVMVLAGGVVLLPNWGPAPAVSAAWQIPMALPPRASDAQQEGEPALFSPPSASDQKQATQALRALHGASDTDAAAAQVLDKLDSDAPTAFEQFCTTVQESDKAPSWAELTMRQLRSFRLASTKQRGSAAMQLQLVALLLVTNVHCLSAAVYATNRRTLAQRQSLRMGPSSQTVAVLRDHVAVSEPDVGAAASHAESPASIEKAHGSVADSAKLQSTMASTIASLEALGISDEAATASGQPEQGFTEHHAGAASHADSTIGKLERIAQGRSAHSDEASSATRAMQHAIDWRDHELAARLQCSQQALDNVEDQIRQRMDDVEEDFVRDIACVSRIFGEDMSQAEAQMMHEMFLEAFVEEKLESFGGVQPVLVSQLELSRLRHARVPATLPQQFAACQYLVRSHAQKACSPLMGLEVRVFRVLDKSRHAGTAA